MWPARSVSSVVCSGLVLRGPRSRLAPAAPGSLASIARSPPRPRRRSAYIARFVAFCLRFARGFYLFSSAPRIRLGVAVGPGRRAARRRRGAGATAAVPRAGRGPRGAGTISCEGLSFSSIYFAGARGGGGASGGRAGNVSLSRVPDRTCVPGGRLRKVALLRRAGRVCGGGGGGGGAGARAFSYFRRNRLRN